MNPRIENLRGYILRKKSTMSCAVPRPGSGWTTSISGVQRPECRP